MQRLELERSSPLASTSYEEGPQRTAVLLYTARYYSGMPFQDPVTVLIKEYLPECRSAAYAELEVPLYSPSDCLRLTHPVCPPSLIPSPARMVTQAMRRLLDGLPEEKWSAAVQPVGDGPPVVQLLGYYLADPSLAAAERAAAEGQVICSSLPPPLASLPHDFATFMLPHLAGSFFSQPLRRP